MTDDHVAELHGDRILEQLRQGDFATQTITVPSGEQSKSLAAATHLWDRLAHCGFARRSVLVAFGGGTITDLTGFVAAGYMRGVPYMNVPTSLVAQLDAAIGSKVGVDHPTAKNLIGFFHHPLGVLADIDFLRTLPACELRQGLAEAIKVAVIDSPRLFEFIEQHGSQLVAGDVELLSTCVEMAIGAKVRLLAPDLYESNLRRGLNFGHAVGHAIEAAMDYKGLNHGDAVSVGMATAVRISRATGLCGELEAERLLNLLRRLGLPTVVTGLDSQKFLSALAAIRAVRNGSFHEVLPTGIGQYVFSDDLAEDDIRRHLDIQSKDSM